MNVTPSAQKQLKMLFNNQSSKRFFRVFIMGGGCSGFQYEFDFTDMPEEDDVLINDYDLSPGKAIVIDSISIDYLQKASLDYQRNLSGARFIIVNPREQRVCGCGLSVSFE